MDKVVAIHNAAAWQEKFNEAVESNKLLLVDFTASWCGPCKMISPTFAELSKIFTDAIFVKVDVDQLPNVAAEWKVEAMPTFLFLKDGKVVDKLVGADKDQLKKKVGTHCAAPAAQSS